MSLFSAGQNSHFLDVITNTGDPSLMIWRSSISDFNSGTVLIVKQGEEAIFIKNGQYYAKFSSGRHELTTENFPFIAKLRSILTGGKSFFSADIYFIRRAVSTEILWGTDSPIQLRDPVQGIMTSVRARGAYKIKVNDPVVLINSLTGNVSNFSPSALNRYFSKCFQQLIKSIIATKIQESGTEILGICARLTEFSNYMFESVSAELVKYGLSCESFNVEALDIPEDDPNRIRLEESYQKTRELKLMGKDYKLIKGMEILKDFANNQGTGGIAGIGAGLGMGMAVMGPAGSIASELMQKSLSDSQDDNDPVKILEKLKVMLDHKLIEKEEYDAVKNRILQKMV